LPSCGRKQNKNARSAINVAEEKKVSVKVDLDAKGNLQDVLKASSDKAAQLQNQLNKLASSSMVAGMTAAGSSSIAMIGGMSAAGRAAGAATPIASAITRADDYRTQLQNAQNQRQAIAYKGQGMGGPEHMAALQTEIAASKELAAQKQREARVMNVAQYGQLGAAAVETGGALKKLGAEAAVAIAGLTGFAAAAGPGAFQTLTGSMQLVAGEIGIVLMPAIVSVAGTFQSIARSIRSFDEATHGIIGTIAGAAGPWIAIASVVGGGVLVLGKFVAGITTAWSAITGSSGRTAVAVSELGVAAQIAAGQLGAAGATAGAGNLVGGGAAAAGGGSLAGFGSRLMRGFGIAAVGSIASEGAGAITTAATGSEKAGGYVSSIGSGAAIGAGIGSLGGPIGTAIGAAIGGIAGGIKAFISSKKEEKPIAVSYGFQPQSMGIGEVGALVQHEAMRDPLQQEQFDMQMRALERLIQAVDRNTTAQPWQPGGG